MTAYGVTVLLLFWYAHFTAAWDPDAGLVTSLTKFPHVTMSAKSDVASIRNIMLATPYPISGSCSPSEYQIRPDFNILLGGCRKGLCDSTIHITNIADITDGSSNMVARVRRHTHNGHTSANFTVTLKTPQRLALFAIDGRFSWDVSVYATSENGDMHLVETLTNGFDYGLHEVNMSKITFNITKIGLKSKGEIDIREIGALAVPKYFQRIRVNLGSSKNVSFIETRRTEGPNKPTYVHDATLQVSADGGIWIKIAVIDTRGVHTVMTEIPYDKTQFIFLEYFAMPRSFKEVYCWEIDAWDHDGPFGRKPKALPQKKSLREILGVNGVWGWGHDVYSESLPPGQGPERYITIATHARNAHALEWDVTDPDYDPNFFAMSLGNGTQAKRWLNWDREYVMWKKAGLFVDAAIQFTNFTEHAWKTPEASAYNYGRAFAAHFGSVSGNRLVDAIEIGYHPWNYNASLYRRILKGMSAGVRSVDDKLVVLPGAFQADDKLSTLNYIGTRVTEDTSRNISAINSHQYSFRNHEEGLTYPEDERSSFQSLRNIFRWRDTNLPGKPVWVTEWGWDADGEHETCRSPDCVSSSAQAVYGIRGLLIMVRYGVERASWFSYANSDECDTSHGSYLFCRSGLTESRKYNFAKKPVFSAFEKLLSHIGDAHFLSALKEDNHGYVYLFGPSYSPSQNATVLMQKTSHIVGWLPFPASSNAAVPVTINLATDVYPFRGWRFTGSRFVAAGLDVLPLTKLVFNENHFTMYLSAEPAVYELRKIIDASVVG